MAWTTLDGYEVIAETKLAVLVQKGGQEIWVPRSQIMDGDAIEKGDTDLTVQNWFCVENGLEG